MAARRTLSKTKGQRSVPRRPKLTGEQILPEDTRSSRQIKLLQTITEVTNEAGPVESALQSALRLVCAHAQWPLGFVIS